MREVIILGMGPSKIECKYHCETWGVNGTYWIAKRLDKLFFTDEPGEVEKTRYDLPRIKRTAKTLVFPIAYPKFKDLGVPIEIIPINEVISKFKTRFFSNTIAYMLAYALLYAPEDEHYKIYFYGIDMMTNTTYVQEKGGVEYWMGIAQGMSIERQKQGKPPIEIINTKSSATGKTWNGKMYGYWGELEQEKVRERLLAPWEIVKESVKQPNEEWVRTEDGNWIKVPYAGGMPVK